jgi:hypothetical protein
MLREWNARDFHRRVLERTKVTRLAETRIGSRQKQIRKPAKSFTYYVIEILAPGSP